VRIAVISDTHLPRGGRRDLPPACRAAAVSADLLVHAGDLADLATLRMLEALGPPLVAVHGNADASAVRAALPATAEVEAAGLRLAVVHDAGPRFGRLERLRRRFPDAGAVIFGHSHTPLLQRADDGFLILNPGSPTDRRRQPRHSMAVVEAGEGRTPAVRFLAVDEPVGPLPAEMVQG
jgi:putative phosphoesterase